VPIFGPPCRYTVTKRAYFMTSIDDVFHQGRARDKQTAAAFQSSRFTGVRLRAGLQRCSHFGEREDDELGRKVTNDNDSEDNTE